MGDSDLYHSFTRASRGRWRCFGLTFNELSWQPSLYGHWSKPCPYLEPVKTIIYQFSREGQKGVALDDKLVGFLKKKNRTVHCSDVKQSHRAASEFVLESFHCPSVHQQDRHCSSLSRCSLFDHRCDPARFLRSLFLSIKRRFPSRGNKEGGASLRCWRSCGDKPGATDGCSRNDLQKEYCTQLFIQKVSGGDWGSSGQSSAIWDPEWSEHLQPTLGNWKQYW